MRQSFILGAVAAALCSSSAFAAPDCLGAIALNAAGKKVARISCRDDHAPGTAQNYKCSIKWKIKTADGVERSLGGSFVVTRGEKQNIKLEETRIDGVDIDDEVGGISISCAAQP